MTAFMNEDYLLESALAKRLYKKFAAGLPIVDYHCHVKAEEIAADKVYENPAEIMLGGDHYKWRLMRGAGIDETLITGTGSDWEKFLAFAKAVQLSPGHPVYAWTHMELRTYFDYTGNLNEATAEEVWKLCCEKLQNGLSARKIIQNSRVEVICTTDDPADDLKSHIQCRNDGGFPVSVLPTYRPDRAVNIHREGFLTYIEKLEEVSGEKIRSLQTLKKVLSDRLEWFVKNGCKVADHGLDRIFFSECSEDEAERIFSQALKGRSVSQGEAAQYITNLMQFFARLYAKRHIVMQLHYGALRDVNTKMMNRLGPDTGFDCINDTGCGANLAAYLNSLERTGQLPKTIVYSLNPTDNALIDTVAGSFFEAGVKGKVQHGAAWWFNDNKRGIEEHLATYASLTPVGSFLGMLTDSRCFLSLSRHDYFRRIFCNWLAQQIEMGQYPADEGLAGEIIEKVSYENCKKYFNF